MNDDGIIEYWLSQTKARQKKDNILTYLSDETGRTKKSLIELLKKNNVWEISVIRKADFRRDKVSAVLKERAKELEQAAALRAEARKEWRSASQRNPPSSYNPPLQIRGSRAVEHSAGCTSLIYSTVGAIIFILMILMVIGMIFS